MLPSKSLCHVDEGGTWYFSDRLRFSSFKTTEVCRESEDEAIIVFSFYFVFLALWTFQVCCF